MDDDEYKEFSYFNRNKMLFLNVLTDGERSYDYATTYEEEALLSSYCDKLYDRVLELKTYLLSLPFNDKYRDIIQEVADIVKYDENECGKFGYFNTFNIFSTYINF